METGIDANEVIRGLSHKLADKEVTITILEAKIRQLEAHLTDHKEVEPE